MRWVRFAALLATGAVLQMSFMESFSILNAKCDLLLIMLVFFAIYYNGSDAIITSFVIGFAADVIGSAMGPRIISYGLFGTLLVNLHRIIAIRKMPHQSIVIFILGVLTQAGAAFLGFVKGAGETANLYQAILGASAYSALVGPFFFLPFAWWMGIKTNRSNKYYAQM